MTISHDRYEESSKSSARHSIHNLLLHSMRLPLDVARLLFRSGRPNLLACSTSITSLAWHQMCRDDSTVPGSWNPDTSPTAGVKEIITRVEEMLGMFSMFVSTSTRLV